MRTAIALIIAVLAGCSTGESRPKARPPAAKAPPAAEPGPDPRAGPLRFGDRMLVYSELPGANVVYCGNAVWPVPVGSAVTVVEDPGGNDPNRRVRINVPASSVPEQSSLGEPSDGDLVTTIFRSNLRPAP